MQVYSVRSLRCVGPVELSPVVYLLNFRLVGYAFSTLRLSIDCLQRKERLSWRKTGYSTAQRNGWTSLTNKAIDR